VQTEAERAATYIEEGSMLLSRGDKETATARLMKAADEYAAALERHPDDAGWAPYLKHQIGLAYMLAGERDAARQAFVRLVVEHPDNGWAWVAFDYMDLGMERPERPPTVRMGGEDEQ
jgi:tetratricopeptide (TPR) repeat protein